MFTDTIERAVEFLVEYRGMVEDARYRRAREIKFREYNPLHSKLLSIEREDFVNLDERLREKFRELGVMLD